MPTVKFRGKTFSLASVMIWPLEMFYNLTVFPDPLITRKGPMPLVVQADRYVFRIAAKVLGYKISPSLALRPSLCGWAA